MSIQTELDRIIAAVGNAHKKVKEKGGTTAEPYLVGNLEAAIDSIPEGVTLPTLTNPGAAADLLTGKELINAAGEKVTGSMPNNGAVSATLDLDTTSYTPAQGYHSGSGKVQVDSSINTTVDTQADLIAQIKSEHETQIAAIKTALEGKTAGGGGSGDASVETCTVTVNVSRSGSAARQIDVEFTIVEEDGSISFFSNTLEINDNRTETYTVVKNTLFIALQEGYSYDYEVSGEVYDYIENVFEVTGDGSISITL